ncbi:hypothetical protein ACGFNU_01835 [Spirillospora sp. NPDC048911]|uniref:hypothetical protein n=1 Tax=Spirillospora sp. NPDC048911 TaxID=3364527 RepID=UPI003715E4F1
MTVRVLGLKSGVTAEDHRLGMSLFSPALGGVLERRSGVVYHPGSCELVTAGLPRMQARLSPFLALVDGTSAPLQGAYPVVSDTDLTITFDAGEASVSRVDRIIVRVRDDLYDASGEQSGKVEYLKGRPTGAASAVPSSSLLLWEVTVAAGASAGSSGPTFIKVEPKFPYTAAPGAPIPVTGQAERDALPAQPLLSVQRLDTGDVQQYWNGWRSADWLYDTGWVPITTFSTGWQPSATAPPRVRRVGSLVEMRGVVVKKAGAFAPILALPSEFRSPEYLLWPAPYVNDYRQAHLTTGPGNSVAIDVGHTDIPAESSLQLDNIWLIG